MEDEAILPWVGPGSKRNCLNIVVTSTNYEIITKISEALSESHSKGCYKWKLALHKALRFEDMMKSRNMTGQIAMDFVVIAMDTSRVFCLDWARQTYQQIHPDLKKRRVILVSPLGLPINVMKVDSADIVDFTLENDLDMVSLDIYKPEELAFLEDHQLICAFEDCGTDVTKIGSSDSGQNHIKPAALISSTNFT